MKKYRFYDPSQRTPLERARPFIFMFVGWNIIGVLIWKYVNRQASENDPAWEMRSQIERIAALTGSPTNAVKRKITLFGSPEQNNDEDKS